MKIVKFVASFLIFWGIVFLMIWAILKSKENNCTSVSVLVMSSETSQLLSKSDILNILKQHNVEWEGKAIKDIDLASVNKILTEENYIKSVDKIHFLGSKLQIEVTLFDILMDVHLQNGEKFLLDMNGTHLPYSPKVENGVMIAQGAITNNYRTKEIITPDNHELYELFTMASLLQKDPFYKELFHRISINEKQEMILYPSVGNIPVLFGSIQDARNKLKTLKYMYEEVLPYLKENQYAQLDARFKNRIVAIKSKT
jgi:cell division protein FtsQ